MTGETPCGVGLCCCHLRIHPATFGIAGATAPGLPLSLQLGTMSSPYNVAVCAPQAAEPSGGAEILSAKTPAGHRRFDSRTGKRRPWPEKAGTRWLAVWGRLLTGTADRAKDVPVTV